MSDTLKGLLIIASVLTVGWILDLFCSHFTFAGNLSGNFL